VNQATLVHFTDGAGNFFVFDYEILSTVICTVLLLWHVQKLSVPCDIVGTGTGKLLNSLPRNDVVAELCSRVNSMWLTAMIQQVT
jgi:hypothetical protein